MKPVTTVHSGHVSLAVYTWGIRSPGKPAVLLVHGYPDSAAVWEDTAKILAADHFVIAYDVRGAGQSGTPARIADFNMTQLVEDMATVLDAVCPDQPVHLVGHDWGGIQSWEAVCTDRLKGRLRSYTTASGPCLDHIGHWMRDRLKNPSVSHLKAVGRQMAHSWYVYMFHLPLLAPTLWKRGLDRQWPRILSLLEGVNNHRNPTQRRDGAVGVNLYRANIFQRLFNPRERRTDLPVQLIVAKRDPFMIAEIFEDLPHWVPNLWTRDIDAGHWLQSSRPAWTAQCIRDFVCFVDHGRPVTELTAAQNADHRAQAA